MKKKFNIQENFEKIKKLQAIRNRTPTQNRELKQRLYLDDLHLNKQGLVREKKEFIPKEEYKPKLKNNLKLIQELMDTNFKTKEQQIELRERLKIQKYFNDTGKFMISLYDKLKKNKGGNK